MSRTRRFLKYAFNVNTLLYIFVVRSDLYTTNRYDVINIIKL